MASLTIPIAVMIAQFSPPLENHNGAVLDPCVPNAERRGPATVCCETAHQEEPRPLAGHLGMCPAHLRSGPIFAKRTQFPAY
jgi:hypothetical protein